jgi:hypothetical protein
MNRTQWLEHICPKFVHVKTMDQTPTGSFCSKPQKPDSSVWETGRSGFIETDGTQGHRRTSTREPLPWPSDV